MKRDAQQSRSVKLGRPQVYDEPRRRINVFLPADLLAQIEATGQTLTEWLTSAMREKLERQREQAR